MNKTYSFATQLQQGEAHEQRLDAFFRGKGFRVYATDMAGQRQGIDRIFVREDDGKQWTVEYKADSLAGRTGNAFVETVSVDSAAKAGWAFTSKAALLVYLIVEPETIYCVSMARLRHALPRWQASYRTVPAQNEGYATHGVLVPLWEIERISMAVF